MFTPLRVRPLAEDNQSASNPEPLGDQEELCRQNLLLNKLKRKRRRKNLPKRLLAKTSLSLSP